MARSHDRALDSAITALLREALENSRAMRQALHQVGQLIALRVELARSESNDGLPQAVANGHVLPPLTKREQEVLDQLVRGRSNRLIARSLGISERTVKNHLRNIFTKLGVGDRTSAVVKALGGNN